MTGRRIGSMAVGVSELFGGLLAAGPHERLDGTRPCRRLGGGRVVGCQQPTFARMGERFFRYRIRRVRRRRSVQAQ
jgi:hypothetical protein